MPPQKFNFQLVISLQIFPDVCTKKQVKFLAFPATKWNFLDTPKKEVMPKKGCRPCHIPPLEPCKCGSQLQKSLPYRFTLHTETNSHFFRTIWEPSTKVVIIRAMYLDQPKVEIFFKGRWGCSTQVHCQTLYYWHSRNIHCIWTIHETTKYIGEINCTLCIFPTSKWNNLFKKKNKT